MILILMTIDYRVIILFRDIVYNYLGLVVNYLLVHFD